MSNKVVDRSDVTDAFASLSDEVLCTIGANLDHYLYLCKKNNEVASFLGLTEWTDDVHSFCVILHQYLNIDGELESDKDIFYE